MNEPNSSHEGDVPRLFGTDGIRDIAGQGRLTPEVVARVGRALTLFVRARRPSGAPLRFLLGRDPRPSGESLTEQLAVHMAAEGAEVVDAGILPSPALAWLTASGGYDLGCAISASHNTPEYNGIKPFLGGGRKLSIEHEHEVEALAAEVTVGGAGARPRCDAEARSQYARETLAFLEPGGRLDGLDLVIDLSAGAATEAAPPVLEALGARLQCMHAAHSRPINENCGSEHPEALIEAVRSAGASAGLAFDGDADRVVVIDETGAALDGDDVLALLAADLHSHGGGVPGDAVVSTVMANLGLEEFLEPFGVVLERTPVGDRHVAERMREVGSVLGGEQAGHIVRPRTDLPGTAALIGDGLVAGVQVLQAARRSGEPLSVWRAKRKRYPQLLVNVRMEARRPLDAWPVFEDALAVQERALAGVGRLVVRYSGTEPLLRIMAEGREPGAVKAAVDALAKIARDEGK